MWLSSGKRETAVVCWHSRRLKTSILSMSKSNLLSVNFLVSLFFFFSILTTILKYISYEKQISCLWQSVSPHGCSSSGSSVVKNPPAKCKRLGFDPWVRKIPWRRKWQPTPVFLPGKSHRQRSLVGYSPWGHKESDTTEQLTLSLFIGMKAKNMSWH